MGEDAVEGSFWGQTVKITGRETIYLLITSACLVVVGYMLWHSTQNMLDKTDDQTRVITGQHMEMRAQHDALKSAIDTLNTTMEEQNYIITLPNEKREKLNLAMPQSLRSKLDR